MNITILVGPVYCTILTRDVRHIYECLSWKATFWQYNKKTKRRKQGTYIKDVFIKGKDTWLFPAGLLKRVIKFCLERNIKVSIEKEYKPILSREPFLPPDAKFQNFREDQLAIIKRAKRMERGIIKAPPGIGKTILQLGLLSCYPNCYALIMAHTTSLVKQTVDEMIRFEFQNVQMIGGGLTGRPNNQYVVATMQSMNNLPPETYRDHFDIVIVDEVHHVRTLKGDYVNVLSECNAPMKWGFTATTPDDTEGVFASEGFIGPIVGELTIQEGIELGLLVHPRVRILKVPYSSSIHRLRRYPEVYEHGIVQYTERNRLIAGEIKEWTSKGKSVMVLVTKIAHGNLIQAELSHLGVRSEFVQGNTVMGDREEIKSAFKKKDIKCVIATAVWREGINIPTLDVVVNAAGSKGEIPVLQGLGRVLRKAEGKDEAIIVDFYDPSHYFLISHFGERITLYIDSGWKFI